MKTVEDQLEDYKKMNEAKNAFISGIIMGWVHQLENESKVDHIRIIEDMKKFSETIAKSAGVIITDDSDI